MPLERFIEAAERPAPVVHPETAPFWDAIAEGSLVLQRCSSCQVARYPLAPVCWSCGSFDWDWTPAKSTEGIVAVVARVHRATGDQEWQAYAPYFSGLVDIEDGLRLPARILCTCDAVTKIGTAVRAVTLVAPHGAPVYGFAHSCVSA